MDTAISVEENKASLERALKKGKNRSYRIKAFPRADHLMRVAVTDKAGGNSGRQYVAGYLETMVARLGKRVRTSSGVRRLRR